VSKFRIFFSWQSDHDKKISHHFILNALRKSAKKAKKNELQIDLRESNEWEFEIDHDTKGEPGFVDIFESIKKKIDNCDHFVADLSPVGRTLAGKALPNPNVMIELGYALKTKSHRQITVVANDSFYNDPNDLPFNIRGRRAPILYSLTVASNLKDIKLENEKLAEALKSDLSQVEKLIEPTENVDSKDSGARSEVFGLQYFERVFGENSHILKNARYGATGKYEGSKLSLYFPDAPYSYIKIIPNSSSLSAFMEIKNQNLDPKHNGINYFLDIGQIHKIVGRYNSIISMEYVEKSGRQRPVSAFDVESKTAKIHMMNFSANRGDLGDITHGTLNSYSSSYGGKFDNSWIDLERVFSSWGKALSLASKIFTPIGRSQDVSVEAGIVCATTIECRYSDQRDVMLKSPRKRLYRSQNLWEGGIRTCLVELIRGVSDDMQMFIEPSSEDLFWFTGIDESAPTPPSLL